MSPRTRRVTSFCYPDCFYVLLSVCSPGRWPKGVTFTTPEKSDRVGESIKESWKTEACVRRTNKKKEISTRSRLEVVTICKHFLTFALTWRGHRINFDTLGWFNTPFGGWLTWHHPSCPDPPVWFSRRFKQTLIIIRNNCFFPSDVRAKADWLWRMTDATCGDEFQKHNAHIPPSSGIWAKRNKSTRQSFSGQ